jgi:hypothetical protein
MRININNDNTIGCELIRLSDMLGISPTRIVMQLIENNNYDAHFKDADNVTNKRTDTDKELLL